MRYFLKCAKSGTFRAVHVRNIHPMSPLLTGALSGKYMQTAFRSEKKKNLRSPKGCMFYISLRLSDASCFNFTSSPKVKQKMTMMFSSL